MTLGRPSVDRSNATPPVARLSSEAPSPRDGQDGPSAAPAAAPSPGRNAMTSRRDLFKYAALATAAAALPAMAHDHDAVPVVAKAAKPL